MDSYLFLLDLAIILLCTKLLGLFTRRMRMPQVVGALIAGLLLGPTALNLVAETDFIRKIAELGVIILMFTAGLETDIVELKKAGRASFVVALCGVLLPLGGGAFLSSLFNRGGLAAGGGNLLLQNFFIGVVLTATSVSITVETLKELGKLDTRAGSVILGAALIDDILGIIALTVITSFADSSVSVAAVLLKIALFFVFLAVAGFLFFELFESLIRLFRNDMRRFAILAFVFCLSLAYAAERFFGVADITGAYFAGLIICNTQKTKYIASRFETLSFLLFSPIFFANIGLQAKLTAISGPLLLFTVLLLAVAVLAKLIGCGLGALLCGYSRGESLQIGAGMAARGEVALIVTSKGMSMGVINSNFYGPIIIMVIATAVIAPTFLKFVIGRQRPVPKYTDLVESRLVDAYQETEQFDLAQQALLKMHRAYRGEPVEEEEDAQPQKPPPSDETH